MVVMVSVIDSFLLRIKILTQNVNLAVIMIVIGKIYMMCKDWDGDKWSHMFITPLI